MDERCEFTDLPRVTCAHCTGRSGDPADAALLSENAPGPWIEAKYRSGQCSGCGRPIRPGMQIRSDGQGGWLCDDPCGL